MIEINKILFPTDFSKYADHAKLYAMEMAKQFNSKIILLHVFGLPHYNYSADALRGGAVAFGEEVHDKVKNQIEELAAEINEAGIEVESFIRDGQDFVEIVHVAREEKVDLIIMGTHGWGFFRHLLIGSTAERVVAKAPCPVLTIRHPEHEFIHP